MVPETLPKYLPYLTVYSARADSDFRILKQDGRFTLLLTAHKEHPTSLEDTCKHGSEC